MKKLALFLTLALLLCGCAPTHPVETDTTTKFASQGFTLSVPNEYVDLLIVDTKVNDGADGTFFSVHEKASVEASKKLWPDDPAGGGFLFGIGRVDETHFNEMMAWGMTGADVFARDSKGNYYIYYHPTDVQLIRVDDYTDADWEQWGELGQWGAQAKESFIADNPGLTAYQRTYTDLDCALVHVAFWKEEHKLREKGGGQVYTPGHPKSLPYVERLLDDVMYFGLLTTEELNPDGHYIRLSVPGTLPHTSFDFFTDEGQQQYIRQNFHFSDDTEIEPTYLVASKDGGFFPAGKVLSDWLAALD